MEICPYQCRTELGLYQNDGKRRETKDTVFSQYDPKWGGNTYCNGNPVRTISTSGCGVVSFVNAIYALNGEYIDPTMLAQYSNSHGHYFYMQGTADTLYEDFARAKGKFYHFKWDGKIYDMTSLKRHLQNGGTAVALVPGHYIAIVDYRETDNSFLVLDSAIYSKRPTTIQWRLDQRSDPPKSRNAVLLLFPSLQPRKIMAKTACILQKVMIKY